MAVVQLDDGTARVEVTIFNELFEASRSLLKEDTLLIVEGRPQHDEFTGGIRISVEKVLRPAGRAPALRARHASWSAMADRSGSQAARAARARIATAACPVSIIYSNQDAECRIDLGRGVAGKAGRRSDPVACGVAAGRRMCRCSMSRCRVRPADGILRRIGASEASEAQSARVLHPERRGRGDVKRCDRTSAMCPRLQGSSS